jgi:hypothetical protein
LEYGCSEDEEVSNNFIALEIQRIKLEVISKSYSKTMRIEYRCSEDEESAIIL